MWHAKILLFLIFFTVPEILHDRTPYYEEVCPLTVFMILTLSSLKKKTHNGMRWKLSDI